MEEVKNETNLPKEENKKMKNLIAALILVSGLFVGSVFVDVSQMIKGEGFSNKNLSKGDVFEAVGKTWVAYTEPAVSVKVINDSECENCDPSEVLVWLRRVAPTISAEEVEYDSEEGKNLIEKMGIKTLPALVFSGKISETELYAQAGVIFEKKDNDFVLKTEELGVAPGKYLESPAVNENDAISGSLESPVKVVVFSDFQCPYSKVFQASLRENMKEYEGKASFVYKNLPLSFHKQAENAALAGQCALEQGKFWEYSDKLFENQDNWGNSTGTAKFKEYAKTLNLNQNDFNTCLDQKKYADKIAKDMEEAQKLGVSGTPAIFVNDQFKNAAISSEELKGMIEKSLSK